MKANIEFISKMIDAKKLEEEAIISLFPKNMQKHLNVINKEVQALLIESVVAMVGGMNNLSDPSHNTENNKTEESSSSVRKVEIG